MRGNFFYHVVPDDCMFTFNESLTCSRVKLEPGSWIVKALQLKTFEFSVRPCSTSGCSSNRIYYVSNTMYAGQNAC